MMQVAVIGRGLAGLATAFALSEKGNLALTIFGSKEAPENASHVAQGVICNKGLLVADSPLFKAKLAGAQGFWRWLKRIEQASGKEILHLRAGVHELFASFSDYKRMAERVYRGNLSGCYGTRYFGKAALWRSLPRDFFDNDKVQGSLFYPEDGWVNTNSLLESLEMALEKRGSQFTNCQVGTIIPRSGSAKGVLLRGGKEFVFDKVVVCAGAGSRNIFSASGIFLPELFGVAGQVMTATLENTGNFVLVKDELSLACCGKMLIFGSTSAPPGTGHADEFIRWDEELTRALGKRFLLSPQLVKSTVAQRRWAVRVRTKDRLPVVGALPWVGNGEQVYIVCGLYKNGLQLAHLCATHLGAVVYGETVPAITSAFDASRFLPI